MARLQALIEGGDILFLVLVVFLLEGAVISLIYFRRNRRGLSPADFLTAALPGALIFCALAAVLFSWGWMWTASFMAASLVAHLFDLRARWQAADASHDR
ncbi:MAG: hypothetical protein AAGF15_09265 [Pseudomonadota bacterium]